MNLTPFQKISVDNLYDALISQDKEVVYFNAPTGSGKTFMMANLINDICMNQPNQWVIIFSTLSSGSLHLQSKEAFDKYSVLNSFAYKTDTLIFKNDDSKWDRSFYKNLQPNIVYCIGNASLGEGRNLTKNGRFTNEILQAKQDGYKILFIRDEAHNGMSSDKPETIKNLLSQYADKILNISATLPKDVIKSARNDEKSAVVEFSIFDAKQDGLIKKDLYINGIKYSKLASQNFEINKIKETQDTDFVSKTLKEFAFVKKQYEQLIPNIKPALLIQVSSASKLKKEGLEDKNLELTNLENAINTYNDAVGDKAKLSYVIWTDAKKFSSNALVDVKKLEDDKTPLTKRNSVIDIIIFKTALATGWDIPRACMLLRLRNVCSDTLNTQTIGRIQRNPLLSTPEVTYSDEARRLANKYWIYTDNGTNCSVNDFNYLKEIYDTQYCSLVLKNNISINNVAINLNELSYFSADWEDVSNQDILSNLKTRLTQKLQTLNLQDVKVNDFNLTLNLKNIQQVQENVDIESDDDDLAYKNKLQTQRTYNVKSLESAKYYWVNTFGSLNNYIRNTHPNFANESFDLAVNVCFSFFKDKKVNWTGYVLASILTDNNEWRHWFKTIAIRVDKQIHTFNRNFKDSCDVLKRDDIIKPWTFTLQKNKDEVKCSLYALNSAQSQNVNVYFDSKAEVFASNFIIHSCVKNKVLWFKNYKESSNVKLPYISSENEYCLSLPDFILFNSTTNKPLFVEIKALSEDLARTNDDSKVLDLINGYLKLSAMTEFKDNKFIIWRESQTQRWVTLIQNNQIKDFYSMSSLAQNYNVSSEKIHLDFYDEKWSEVLR